MPDQNTPGSLPTGSVPPPLASQPVENEKIEPCPCTARETRFHSAMLAERNKRIATLDGLLREGMGLDDRDRESGDWLDWFKRARAALEGKEAT